MYTLADLEYLMSRLRDPQAGCPWDLEQDFASIVPHHLEEAYEVADTIERQDWPHLKDELGDLLFQVIFYAQLGKEQQRFELAGVIDQLVQKLIRRHPHVFPDGSLRGEVRHDDVSVEQVGENWEAIKQQEREAKDHPSVLDEIPLHMPGLSRAAKLQKRASKVGFDWDTLAPVVDKIQEELDELKEAIQSGKAEDIRDEMGDLIFAQVNLARHLAVDPEQAVRSTNQKFERRFRYVEAQARAAGKNLRELSLEQMDAWWDEAKAQGL